MRILALIALSALMASCASPGIQKIYDERQYSEADRQEIAPHSQEYMRLISRGTAASNAFNTGPQANSVGLVAKYYCACQSKLGEKCQKNSEGLEPEERELWAKGAGAEFALMATGNGAHVDPILCN
jgi:hypothetical protein